MRLKVKYIDMDTGEYTAVLHDEDCMELGVREQDRVKIAHERTTITAIVQTTDSVVNPGEIGILGRTFKTLGAEIGEEVDIIGTGKPDSIEYIRKKMDGMELTTEEIKTLVSDIASRNLSSIELAAYVTALHINGMNLRETADLTLAMVETGDKIEFDRSPVFDFHSVGGVPGNKVTLLVVPIVAAAGLLIPKTSSRAISSAAGTADIVEVFAPVEFTAAELKRIAEKVGGTMAWGGSVNLAPADDLIIRVEYPLGIDPHAQLLASIMSKKKAVGADYVVIDIPTGEGTKVRDIDEAKAYARDFIDLGERLGIKVECAITYGAQPVGRAIGPALEAKEAISILEGSKLPGSVAEKSCELAGMLLEMGGIMRGVDKAKEILESGKALAKFREIVEAQGGNPDIRSDDIPIGKFKFEVQAKKSGYIAGINNKDIVRIARTAGAPKDKGAGIVLNKKRGHKVDMGETLFTIYAENEAKLERAVGLARRLEPMSIEGMVIARVPSFSRVSG
ncbi:MAG: AMP phosphorylase [Methanomassiliicoccales archaeon]|jgi:AMP phosphorylase|nr:AMP phosphorylase [Methanomassiliicoccales archaeon]